MATRNSGPAPVCARDRRDCRVDCGACRNGNPGACISPHRPGKTTEDYMPTKDRPRVKRAKARAGA